MTMDYISRPYICSDNMFKKSKISQSAISFLTVDEVPNNCKRARGLLINFFSSGREGMSGRFGTLVNIVCYNQGSKEPDKIRKIITEIIGESFVSHEELRNLRALFSLCFYYLAVKGVVAVPPSPVLVPTKSPLLFRTPFIDKFSTEVRFWIIAGTPGRSVEYADILEKDYCEAVANWSLNNPGGYKSYNGAVTVIRHYFAAACTSTLDISLLVSVQKTLLAISTQIRSPLAIISIYQKIKGVDLEDDYKREMDRQSFNPALIPHVYKNELINIRVAAGLDDSLEFSKAYDYYGLAVGKNKKAIGNEKLPRVLESEYGTLVYRASGNKPDGCSVYEIKKLDTVTIGDYFITTDKLKYYRPKLLNTGDDNLWVASQLDWLESGFEKATIKEKNVALKYFNAYVFSYLPWFKENIDNDFIIPSDINTFDPNIFVRRTHTFKLRADPNKELPITFPEFLEKIMALGIEGGKVNPNVISTRIRDLHNYFDTCISLQGISLPNPMDLAPKFKGYAYAFSTKVKLDYEYWLLFREFLIVFARCAVTAFNKCIKNDTYHPSLWVDCYREISAYEIVEFGGINLHLSDARGVEEFDPKLAPFYSSLICLISQCGIRFSNAVWLDSRSFDRGCPSDAEDEKLVKLFINTDKTQIRPYQSHVPFKIIKILRNLSQARSMLGFDEPVYYQNNPKSKWGQIIPLFRSSSELHNETVAHSNATKMLIKLIFSFESLLKAQGVNFDSCLYPGCNNFSYDEHVYCLASRTTLPIRTLVAERDEILLTKGAALRPVSMFEYKSSVSLHSFRKTFDSFYSLFMTKEDIGKLFTGQAPQTVGYYAENTVEDYERAAALVNIYQTPFSVGRDEKNPSDVIKALKENGITSNFLTISAGELGDFDLNEEYRVASDRNIAVNRTHICPYNNQCPSKIMKILDNRKLCGICPASLSFASDAPAIACKIKQIGDDIADLSQAIKSDELMDGEKEDYQQKRISLISEFAAWMARHDQLLSMTNGQVLIGEDGHGHYKHKLNYQKPDSSWSDEKTNLWRIFETADVKTMQSDRLKRKASRYARQLVQRIDSKLLDQIEIDPVRTVALHLQKSAMLNGVSLQQAIDSISSYSETESPNLTSLLIGAETDA